MNSIYIAYKTRYQYSTTKNITWAQKLDGPFTNQNTVEGILTVLRAVKRLGDIKDIKILIEQTN